MIYVVLVQRKKREAENSAADRAIISFTQQIQKNVFENTRFFYKKGKTMYKNVTTQRILGRLFSEIYRDAKRHKKWMICINKELVLIDKCKHVNI